MSIRPGPTRGLTTNHAAATDQFLHVGTNVPRGDEWLAFVDLRFPLSDIAAAGSSLPFESFVSSTHFSLRMSQGATDCMYLGTHLAANGRSRQFSVFSWPDASSTVSRNDVQISAWSAGRPYRALCPGGGDWLARCDPRVTGAWVQENVVGFVWTANREAPARPFPYVRLIRIDTTAWAVLDEPDLWSDTTAYAYPDVTPGTSGVALSMFRGGGPHFPSHVVGLYSGGNWQLQGTRNGTHAPADRRWGDYLTCRRLPNGHFLASGFTLQGATHEPTSSSESSNSAEDVPGRRRLGEDPNQFAEAGRRRPAGTADPGDGWNAVRSAEPIQRGHPWPNMPSCSR